MQSVTGGKRCLEPGCGKSSRCKLHKGPWPTEVAFNRGMNNNSSSSSGSSASSTSSLPGSNSFSGNGNNHVAGGSSMFGVASTSIPAANPAANRSFTLDVFPTAAAAARVTFPIGAVPTLPVSVVPPSTTATSAPAPPPPAAPVVGQSTPAATMAVPVLENTETMTTAAAVNAATAAVVAAWENKPTGPADAELAQSNSEGAMAI